MSMVLPQPEDPACHDQADDVSRRPPDQLCTEEGFRQFYRAHRVAVLTHIQIQSPSWDRDQVEETACEVWAAIFGKARLIESNPVGFLFVTVRNTVIKKRLSLDRAGRPTAPDDLPGSPPAWASTARPDQPDELTEAAELIR